VNGEVVRELGVRADRTRDAIAVDGEELAPRARRRTVVLHKPRGVVSTLADPQGRPTVAHLVAGAGERLYPVGRLDLNSTGLLLLTNDGALAAGLLHPRHAVPRVYRVKVDGTPSDEAITRLRRGVRLEDGKTAPARVRVVEKLPTKTWLEVTVTEGRTHLVRRMCEAVGHRVDKLARIRLGPLGLGTLAPGAWRELSFREREALRAAAGLSARGGGAKVPARRRRARRKRPERPPPPPGPRHPAGARSGAQAPQGARPRSPRRPTRSPRS
jgi:23S rRNA pseudouridine2605 synthase